MENQFGSGEGGSAVPHPMSVPSCGASSLPEVLADRAAGGSLTVAEVVAFLSQTTGTRVHRATVWRWVLTGRLASFRVGNKVKTTKRAVLAMLESDAQRAARARRAADEQVREVERAGAEAAARIAEQGSA